MRTPNPSKPHPTIVASADLHLTHHGDGYVCFACRLDRHHDDLDLPNRNAAIVHLRKHLTTGHDTQGAVIP